MNNPAVLRAVLAAVCIAAISAAPALAQRSVDDAIKVIESFRGNDKGDAGAAPASFVAPPRTIADITAILEKQKPDPAKRAALEATVSKEPPAGVPRNELAEFYISRGLAANELGRVQQYLEDSVKAYDLAKDLPNFPARRLVFYVQHIAFGKQRTGDAVGGIEAHNQRLQLAGRIENSQGTVINVYFNLVTTYANQGNLDAARDALAKLEKVANDAGGPRTSQNVRDDWRAQLLRSQAAIAKETGRYAEAEKLLRQSLALETGLVAQEANMNTPPGTFANRRDLSLLELSNVLQKQNRLVEAEAEIRRSLLNRLERNGRYSPGTASDILGLARIVFDQGRYGESEQLADAARDIYENLGHGPTSGSLASARRWIATSQSAQGKNSEARAMYAQIERDIGDIPGLRRAHLDNNFNLATVLLRTGEAAKALPIVERSLANTEKNLGDKAYATAQTRGWLGLLLARMGQNDRAAAAFAAAMPILMSVSRQSEDNDDDGSSVGQRDQQRQRIIEAYLGLLADTKGSAAAAEAFNLADSIRGQSVQRALAASSARAVATDPALANLVRNEQDAQKQAAAMQGLLTNLLTRPTNEQDPKQVQKLREDIDKLRTARARVREEIEKRFPDYVNLIDPKPATIEQAQKSLRPGEALIATYVGADRLFVWAVPHQGVAAYAAAKVTERDIEKLVGDLRKSLDPNAATLEEVPAFDVAAAYKLYELLLQPIEAGWKDAKSLMIVPHKALGQLPTALLVTEKVPQPAKGNLFFAEYKNVPFLARKVAVTQLPSVNALATLRALPAAPADRSNFVAFGDPWFSPEQATEAKAQQVAQLQTRGKLVRRNAPKTEGVDSAELAQLPRLPDTAEEVRSIALALKADLSKDVFIGAAANEKTVKSMDLSKRKVVMFATHGLIPGDLNGLTQPALALSAPAVAGIDGDGLLTMEEVLALKLNADWVVLSACNTATGAGAGAEAVSGLGRAFFYAGTRALLVSNWPVETVSARTLTTDLFRRQAEDSKLARGEAMRQAMVALIDSPGAIDDATKQPMFSYAHPIFWAPFSVVGDGG